ncbi:MAG TPA: multiheme c-type cytochrome [Verrucomicrobiae bacterium]|nr:multiheme c-type cytochrome [Verrucomicrobiae bacterium]
MKISSIKKMMAALAVASLGLGGLPLTAQQVQHLTITQPGGMPGLPVMTGIIQLSNGVQLTWSGPSGYYQVFQKSNNLNAAWVALGKSTNLACTATITKLYSNAFFRVSGPAPKYAGYQLCLECHNNVCRYVTNTAHASAFSNPDFKAAGGQNNASCLPCHTVGYGLPTGFVSATATPRLANVQCENCHGPAANHAANPDDFTVVPRVDIAATVCGGCHSASHTAYNNAPTYEEWSSSGHAAVVPDVLQSMASNTNNIRSCGVCHSGSARLAMIGGKNPAITLTKDYNVPITCAVCHNPHQTNSSPDQLRNPVSSTNYFALTSADTATVAAFTNKYNASININVCAQCHNDRGATWVDTSRAPHHSLQYNFLLGSVGELLNGPATFSPSPHGGLPSSARYSFSGTFYLTNQCASCHMQSDNSNAGNHSFAVASDAVCYNCHSTPPELLQAELTLSISNSVTTLLTSLNQWAARQTNSLLATNGVVAWEYTTPGGLTWQSDSAGIVTSWSLNNPVTFTGPNSAGQALIPDQIKRARFNLYLVLNDGSFGVHNHALEVNLLNAAQIWILQVLQ